MIAPSNTLDDEESSQGIARLMLERGVGMFEWDLQTDQVDVWPMFEQMLGYEEHGLGNTLATWLLSVHPHDQGRFLAGLRRACRDGAEKIANIYRMRHRDGRTRWFLITTVIARSTSGTAVQIRGVAVDVSPIYE